MTNQQLSKIILAIAIMMVIAFISSIVIWKRNRTKHSQIVHYNVNKKNHIYALYRIYIKTPILKRYFGKILDKLETMYPADRIAIQTKATKDMTIALGAAMACMLTIIVFSRGDIFFMGVGLVLVYVIFTQIINTQMDNMETKLFKQFADFLTSVRHYYHDTGDVVDALYMTLDSNPYEIGLHINKIYQIISGTHTEEDVAKYTDIAPNRFLMMFAAICATEKEYGGKQFENGEWLFLKSLNHIKDELNIEILKKQQNNFLFSGLKFVAVAPIFLLKPIELWATSNMPDMAEFYTGGIGTIVIAITFAISIFCYQMITNLKDGRVDEMKENALLSKLATLPIIRAILTAEVNRNYSKSLRYGDNLKIVGEDIGPKEFLLKRILYGLAFMVAFNVVVVFAQAQMKESLLTNFEDTYENSIVPNAEYRETMRTISKDIIQSRDEIETYDKETLIKAVADENHIKKTFAEEIVNEVLNRITEFKEIYYKWYLAIFMLIAAAIGFYTPLLLLMYQLSIMKMNMEDEVVQFQTLVLILMYVDGMNLKILLEWIERFAFCFKASVSECTINLEYSSEKALIKMRDTEPFPPFKRFVDNLLSIDNVGIVSAFDEIESEREFYKKKREQDNTTIMQKKASKGKLIAFVPLIVAVGGYMILPFLQMAIEMMSTMTNAVSSI